MPAKINLYLGVGPLNGDGFHDIATVFHAVDLFDEVQARIAADLSLSVTGPQSAGVPTDAGNLAWQAATLLASGSGRVAQVALELTKRIPVAGGMAGGSADAAATLLACAELWGTGSSRAELSELAARLGSDVAFGLAGGTALGSGRGEVLSPILTSGSLHWVLAFSAGAISAGDAYRELDRQRSAAGHSLTGPAAVPDAMLEALRLGDAVLLAPHLHNDLQPAALALMPELSRTLKAGLAAGSLAAIVSGSGPTCAFLAPDAAAAAAISAELDASGTCRSSLVSMGPVPGARVVH